MSDNDFPTISSSVAQSIISNASKIIDNANVNNETWNTYRNAIECLSMHSPSELVDLSECPTANRSLMQLHKALESNKIEHHTKEHIVYHIAYLIVLKWHIKSEITEKEGVFIDEYRTEARCEKQTFGPTRAISAITYPLRDYLTFQDLKSAKVIENEIGQYKRETERFLSTLGTYEEFTKKVSGDISKFDTQLKSHKEFAEKLKSEFSFAGLSNGLQGLMRQGKSGIKWKLAVMTVIVLALIGIPIVAAYIHQSHAIPGRELKDVLLAAMPFIALEALLIYIFRIVYHEYRQDKSEYAQIAYRNMLCTFVEAFGKFKKEQSDIDLSKFERLIFSSLPYNGGQPQSPIDDIKDLLSTVKDLPIKGG